MNPVCWNIGHKPGNVTHLDQATVSSKQPAYLHSLLTPAGKPDNEYIYYQVKIVNVILALQVKRWFAHWTSASLNKLKDKSVICT